MDEDFTPDDAAVATNAVSKAIVIKDAGAVFGSVRLLMNM
jgi:hypothetical protein